MTTSPLNHSQEVSKKLNNYVPEDAQDDGKLFLKATLQFLPRDGKRNLEADVRACQSDAELRALMENLDTVLLRPLKTSGGKTEMVAPSSRYDTEDSVDQHPVVREQEQLPKEGLSREDNQCVLTSQRNKYLPPPSPNEVVRLEYVGKLIAAYIIPLSMGTVAGEQGRFELAAVWQCLYRYFPGARERFNASSINYISNVMILVKSVHEYFVPFKIALEPLPEADKFRIFHTYSVNRKPLSSALLPLDGITTLVSHNSRYPLSDHTLLETHYLVARILHATGQRRGCHRENPAKL